MINMHEYHMYESEYYRQVNDKLRNWLIMGLNNAMGTAVQIVNYIVVDKFHTYHFQSVSVTIV